MKRIVSKIQPPTQAATVRVFLFSRMLAPVTRRACAGHIVNERASRDPRRHLSLQRNSGKSHGVEKVLNAKKYCGQRNRDAAYCDQRGPGFAAPSGHCCKKPACAAKRRFAANDDPGKPGARPRNMGVHLAQPAGKVEHRHKHEHHDPHQQTGPAHANFGGNAQRRGDQRAANEI